MKLTQPTKQEYVEEGPDSVVLDKRLLIPNGTTASPGLAFENAVVPTGLVYSDQFDPRLILTVDEVGGFVAGTYFVQAFADNAAVYNAVNIFGDIQHVLYTRESEFGVTFEHDVHRSYLNNVLAAEKTISSGSITHTLYTADAEEALVATSSSGVQLPLNASVQSQLGFIDDADTYIENSSADVIDVVVGGSTQLQASSTGVNFPNGLQVGGSTLVTEITHGTWVTVVTNNVNCSLPVASIDGQYEQINDTVHARLRFSTTVTTGSGTVTKFRFTLPVVGSTTPIVFGSGSIASLSGGYSGHDSVTVYATTSSVCECSWKANNVSAGGFIHVDISYRVV